MPRLKNLISCKLLAAQNNRWSDSLLYYCLLSLGLDDSPITFCENNNLTDILRMLLSLRPEISPQALLDLNWEMRRVAVLISVPPVIQVVDSSSTKKEEGEENLKPFTLVSSASFTLPASNIVTNSLTDDLNIILVNTGDKDKDKDREASAGPSISMHPVTAVTEQRLSTAQQRLRERGRERGREVTSAVNNLHHHHHHDDIEWLLENKKCIAIQRFFSNMYKNEPKLWKRIVMYL